MFSRKQLCEAVNVCEVLERYSPTDEWKWNFYKMKFTLLDDIHRMDEERKRIDEENKTDRI